MDKRWEWLDGYSMNLQFITLKEGKSVCQQIIIEQLCVWSREVSNAWKAKGLIHAVKEVTI